MARMLFLLFGVLITNVSEAAFFGQGPYIGLQFGETSNHYSVSMLGLNQAQVHYQNVSVETEIGYLVNQYIGTEVNFLRLSPARIKRINDTESRGKIRDNVISLLLIGNLNFKNGYTLFGKFGAGYHTAYPSSSIRTFSTSDYSNAHVAHFRPVASLGIGYALTKKLGLAVNYTIVFSHRTMPSGTLWGIGLTYFWKDYYIDNTLFHSD